MFRIESIVIEKSNGDKELTHFDYKTGTYTAQNDIVTASLENGDVLQYRIEHNKLVEIKEYKGDGEECQWVLEYSRDN